MSKISVTTDVNGCQMIPLTDVERFGKGGRGLAASVPRARREPGEGRAARCPSTLILPFASP